MNICSHFKSTAPQHFSMLSSEITAHKLQELLHSVNRGSTLTFKFLGLDVTLDNLQKLKHGIPKYVSNDEIVSFERLGVSQGKDIFTVPDLNYESAPHDNSATPKLPLSYGIAINLADALSQNSVLENFTLSDKTFRGAETVAVLQAFKYDSNPVKFILSRTWLGHNGIIALALALSRRCSLQELNLTDVDDDGAKALASAIHQNTTLRKIALFYSFIHHPFVYHTTAELIWALIANFTLQEFSLSYSSNRYYRKCIVCKIMQDAAVPQELQHNHCLQNISLSHVYIDRNAAVALAHIIHQCSSLQTFSLCNCEIEDDGGLHIFQTLCNNSTFQTMELSNISNTTNALAELLHGSTLQELTLSYADIGDNEARVIAQPLHHNNTLKTLNLSHNSITNDGAIALANALHHNNTLQTLNLSHNSITNDGAIALANALHHNCTLHTLDLSYNIITNDGAKALANALINNCTLQTLNLFNTSIADEGATVLAEALKHNSSLKELNLGCNHVDTSGATALLQALNHNSSLQKLDLSSNSFPPSVAEKCPRIQMAIKYMKLPSIGLKGPM